ncbi:sulfatase-like hydrolase/transferase, partial [Escherichia coli]|uniref:sulfatase-like hydrolase/transferase n=1 Tax=Escherichia coli TaxID=562 RepID=UPI00289380B0
MGTTDTLREMQRYKQLNQHGADNWKILPGVPLYDTIVIVTGESVRRDYMSVYGYPVPTTPWLNTAPGLFIDGYTSAAASTVPSLSRTLIYDYEQNPDSGNNVVALAAKAGYSTWWISNQGKLGEHDTRISVIASDAEHTVFLKKGSFASRKTDDMLLLQETERALADKSSPKVIFLHMMGSHPNPCDRLHSWPNNYQEQFPRKIACYLASISKLDNFLGQLDGILRRHSRHFAMLYFSDHGLSVSDSANPVHHDGHVQGGYSVRNNVVALAAKAGYSTWWISNQGKLGEHDTRISVIASDAEHTVFLKKGSFASRKTDDMLLLQETERALADKSSPKVIFLHMIGSHPNPCDRLNSWPNYYLEQYPRKIACYLASISKLDNFLGQLDGILRRHSRHFVMLYFSDHGLSVSDSANPVHHDGHVQGGYSV